jgi:uncharacterized membrane protein
MAEGLNMADLITDYFIKPVVEKSGYNVMNTLVYAVIAIAAAFVIYKALKKRFDKRFMLYIIPFILLGSTVRVVTDSIDTGVAEGYRTALFGLVGTAIDSHVYDYSFLTVTPGIYIVTAVITLLALLASDILKNPKIFPLIGILLWLPHFVLLLPMFKHWEYAAAILGLLAFSYVASAFALKRLGVNSLQGRIAVLAHGLDGCASFVAIEVFNRFASECTIFGRCYAGQHVVERFFGDLIAYGTAMYLAVKLLFIIIASRVVEKESEDEYEMNFIYALLIIFGLAPGIRNLLRILVGA